MSVIQRIRDKYARVAVIAIALALLGFIAMDAFTGRSQLFGGGPSNTVGRVNGQRIDIDDFRNSVTEQEQMLESQRYPAGAARTQQAIDRAWNQQVTKALLTAETDKLGLTVTKKELDNMLFVNPPENVKQLFTNPETGAFDAQALSQRIRQVRKSGTKEDKAAFSSFFDQLELSRLQEKYNCMLDNSINIPKWILEKQNAESNQLAKVSFTKKLYTDIPDSTIKVSDAEIADYVSKHKDQFKQQESRAISYVSFSAAPSAADTAAVKESLLQLKPEMDSIKDVKRFLAAQGGSNYYDSYINGNTIQLTNKDSIFKIPVGSTYGPYLDGGSFTLAKLVGVRQIPDSVKARHILIGTMQRDQQGNMQQVRDTAEARVLIDSVRRLINSGQPFDSVCLKFSDDGGSKEKGGVYETGSGQMVPEFNDFIFTRPVGSKDVVLTDFGFHYIEILSQKGSATGYKIAQLSKPILASPETEQKANNDASNFAVESKDEKSFNEVFEKKWKPLGYNKGMVPDIRPSSYDLMGLGVAREFVKKIYDAKKGEVLQPEEVNDNYVVAVVTDVNKEGTQSIAKARIMVEPLLRTKKKAEQIKKQIGNITSLEAVAAVLKTPVDVADSIRINNGGPKIGYEPKLIGAAFNPGNRGKLVTEAIEAQSGVFVIKVDEVTATAATGINIAEQRKQYKMYIMQRSQQGGNPNLDFLRESATIKDNRTEHNY